MASVKVPDNDLGTFNDLGPSIYPICSECQSPWTFSWCLGMSGSRWLWIRSCKHKSASPILVNRQGKEVES